MKKAVSAIVLCVLLLLSMSLSVFADVNSNRNMVCDWFMVTNTSDFYSGLQSSPYTTEVVNDYDTTTSVPYEGYLLLKESSSAKSFKRYGWAASFVGLETSLDFIPAFMPDLFHVIDVTVEDKTSTGYLQDYSQYFEKVFLTLSDGRSYEITPNAHYNDDTNEYKFCFVQKFTCEVKTYIEALTFYCNIPSGSEGWAKYDIYFDFNFSTTDITDSNMNNLVIDHINTSTQQIVSSINGQTQEIKDALDANADQITGEIQNSTDKITGEIQDSTDQITGEIDESTDKITGSIDNAVEEDFGYEDSEAQGDAEAGIANLKAQINSLSADISQSVSDFKVSIDGLSDSMDQGKEFVWGWLTYVPVWFTAVVVGLAGLLIARKIVK